MEIGNQHCANCIGTLSFPAHRDLLAVIAADLVATGLDGGGDVIVEAAGAAGARRWRRSRGPAAAVAMTPATLRKMRQVRRLKANDRERSRMHALNSALDRLRRALPVNSTTHHPASPSSASAAGRLRQWRLHAGTGGRHRHPKSWLAPPQIVARPQI